MAQQLQRDVCELVSARVINLDSGWYLLKNGLTRLAKLLDSSTHLPAQTKQRPLLQPSQYELLYSTVYTICSQKAPHNYSNQLFQRVKEFLREHIATIVAPAIRNKGGDQHELHLQELAKRWDTHQVFLRLLSRLFAYLEGSLAVHKCEKDWADDLSLHEAGMAVFREEMIDDGLEAVFGLLRRDREGWPIDRALIKDVLRIFNYGDAEPDAVDHRRANESLLKFDMCLLDDTEEHYRQKACAWMLEKGTCTEYMLKAEDCLCQEQEKIHQEGYLYARIEGKILSRVRGMLLLHPPFQQQLFENDRHSECRALLTDARVEDLKRMYKIFCSLPHRLDPIVRSFREHLEYAASALLKQLAELSEMKTEHEQLDIVQNLFDLHKYSKHIVEECFAQNPMFRTVVVQVLSDMFNKTTYGACTGTMAELLASYCDNMLLKVWTGKSRGSICSSSEQKSVEEENLEMAIEILVAYISDKDVFSSFCKRKMARRLLSDKSGGMDLSCHRSFLAKLKQQCGILFTASMEGMLKDVTLAKETDASFREYIAQLSCCTGAMPADTPHADDNERHPIDLRVTILTTVHWPTMLSYSEIKTALNLGDEDDETLRRLLHSLSCAKYKILSKWPASDTVEMSDCFEFNFEFSDRMRFIKKRIEDLIHQKKVVIKDVDKKRCYTVDACLLRIMKAARFYHDRSSFPSVCRCSTTSLSQTIRFIKKRIEDLIHREFLQRDE
ncbi:hypothetical protein L7F22_067759 [Adiantum nelumboides]|nr:hypothetical protein [Adiantum nelumboides]